MVLLDPSGKWFCHVVCNGDTLMYRLMKSEKVTLSHLDSRSVSYYRQIQVSKFQKLSDALLSCETVSDNAGTRYFILNEKGKEYYEGTWVD